MSNTLIIFYLAIIGSVLGFSVPRRNEIEDKTNLNDYVDYMLPTVIKYMLESGLDPMQLPDIKEGFSVQPVVITYHGELELKNGLFKNLRSLRRSGDVHSVTDDNISKITGNFALDNIEFDYDYSAKVMNIGLTGSVEGSIKTFDVFCEIHKNIETNHLQLQNFHIYNAGTTVVTFTGNVLVDWLTNALVGVVSAVTKNVILHFVEKTMKCTIEKFIEEFNNANVIPSLTKLSKDNKSSFPIK